MRPIVNVRAWLLFVALAAGALLFGKVLEPHYPIGDWLFWRYLAAWGWTAVFCVACLSGGARVVSALTRFGERRLAPLTVSFATGVFLFASLFFIAGVSGWLRRSTFFALPALLFLSGYQPLLRELRAAYFSWRRETLGRPWRGWELALVALGVLSLAVICVATLIPENASYDSRWYHLPLAERYVAEHAIRRFPEGALEGGIPHLASLLYAWALLAPGELFDRVVLAAQLEVAAFLFTLAGIPALVRALIGRGRTRSAWVAAFLFPSLFVYDSNLVLGADHIGALWTIPCFLVLLQCLRELRPAQLCLLTIQLSGLAMTKYTATTPAVFPVLAVLSRACYLAYRRLRTGQGTHDWLWGPLTALLSGLTFTAPHWLKNWLWYGDPLYPMLYKHFQGRPWTPESTALYEYYLRMYSGSQQGDPVEALLRRIRSLYDFSYNLYNWDGFHGRFPVFGSAFTFSLLSLPFLRGARRVWFLVLGIEVGVAVWAYAFPGDRYLQALLPWMAAALAAIITLAWREGWPARLGVSAVVGLQVVWGAEFMFWPTHQLLGKSGIALAVDFFQQTWRAPNHGAARTQPFEDWAQIGRSVGQGARLLLHHEHLRFGAGVTVIADAYRTQYGISYGYLGSSPNVYRLLRSFGVTHVVWAPNQVFGEDSIAGELVFHTFVTHLVNSRDFGGRRVAELPASEPPDDGHTVFSYTCNSGYQKGLYDLADLRISPLGLPGQPKVPPPPRVALTESNADELLARASHAVVDPDCAGAPVMDGFDHLARFGASDLWLRRR